MKPIRTSLVAASLLLTLGGTAFAQPGPGPAAGGSGAAPYGNRVERMREHMTERHAKRMADLKVKLKLDASQETAWKTFADALQPPAKGPARPDRAALEKMTTPERIDQMQAWHAQRQAEMQKRADATKSFYAGLNAEQKKTLDTESGRFMTHGSDWGMHRPGRY